MAWTEETAKLWGKELAHAEASDNDLIVVKTAHLAAALEEIKRLRARECHHGWRGSVAEQISTSCPACGLKSLFVGSGGHLTCSSVPSHGAPGCPNPVPADVWRKAEAELERCRQALKSFVQCDFESVPARSLLRAVQQIQDEARAALDGEKREEKSDAPEEDDDDGRS